MDTVITVVIGDALGSTFSQFDVEKDDQSVHLIWDEDDLMSVTACNQVTEAA